MILLRLATAATLSTFAGPHSGQFYERPDFSAQTWLDAQPLSGLATSSSEPSPILAAGLSATAPVVYLATWGLGGANKQSHLFGVGAGSLALGTGHIYGCDPFRAAAVSAGLLLIGFGLTGITELATWAFANQPSPVPQALEIGGYALTGAAMLGYAGWGSIDAFATAIGCIQSPPDDKPFVDPDPDL